MIEATVNVPSWTEQVQRMADAVPHPIIVGCVIVGFGALGFTLAAPIKSKLDQARRSKSTNARIKVSRLRLYYGLLLLAGVTMTAVGTALTINGGQIKAAGQVKQAQDLFDQTRAENARATKEYKTEIGRVMTALNNAKQEQTRLLTEGKIKGLQKDLTAWVDDFAARKPDKQRQFEEAKIANTQKEIQMCADVAPVFGFVLRILEESFRKYAEKTGADIQLSIRPLPQNYYDPNVNDPPRLVRFKGDATWQIYIIANPPAGEDRPILLRIVFTDTERRSGSTAIFETDKGTKLRVEGGGILPTPDTSQIFGQYDIADYEETLGRILQRLVEAQLIQAP